MKKQDKMKNHEKQEDKKNKSVGTDTQRMKTGQLLDADFNITLLNLFMEIKTISGESWKLLKNVKSKY